jgi:cytochrome c oxidase assembly protein subunit 15
MRTRFAAAAALPRATVRRLLAPLRTPFGFRTLTLVAMIGLWAIVPSGAIVRLTGSGLGCPDWPLCDGSVVPAAAGHAWIEFTNRIFSGLVMAAAVITWIAALGLPGRPRALRRWSATIALATFGQIPLGAITVYYDLHPALVSSHFLLSMVALGAGTVLWLRARDAAAGDARGWNRRQGPLALIAGAALGVTLATGVLVTAAGPHSGDIDVVVRYGNFGDALHVHVRAAVAFLVLAAVLSAWLWREGGADRLTRRLTVAHVPLTLLQIGVGEYQFRHGLPWPVVAVHVSLAAALWALTVAIAWGIARPRREPTPARAATPAEAAPALAR